MPIWLRFTLFFLFLLLLLLGTNLYVHRRTADLLGLGRRGKRVLGGLLLTSVLALVVGRAFSEGLGNGLTGVLFVFGSTLQLGVLISVCLLLPVDALRGILWAALRRRSRGGRTAAAEAEPAPPQVPDAGALPAATLPAPLAPPLGRRDFLSRSATGAALVVGGGSSLYGSLLGRHDYRIEELPVRIPGLAPSIDGYSIVQLSDLHFGRMVGVPELEAAVDLVRKARPDLVVLTGDLVDHEPEHAARVGTLIRRLEGVARDGVVAIPGNHDYYAGIEAVLAAVERGGGRVLLNSGRVIGDAGGAFALLGVDDVWADRVIPGRGPDLERAIATVPRDLPRVLLCHNPSFFPEAAPEVALQLSGHTHGGQVQLGVNPAEWVLPYGYVAGGYVREGATLYVNRGFGTAGPPSRVGSPPEVTRVVLVSA